MALHEDIDHTGLPGVGAAAFVGAKAYHNTTHATGGTDVALSLNSEEFDTDAFHDTSTNNSRMTIPTGLGGTYLITFGSFANGASTLYLLLNGTTNLRGARTLAATGAAYHGGYATIQALAQGDYIQVIGSDNRTYGDAADLRAQTTLALVKVG